MFILARDGQTYARMRVPRWSWGVRCSCRSRSTIAAHFRAVTRPRGGKSTWPMCRLEPLFLGVPDGLAFPTAGRDFGLGADRDGFWDDLGRMTLLAWALPIKKGRFHDEHRLNTTVLSGSKTLYPGPAGRNRRDGDWRGRHRPAGSLYSWPQSAYNDCSLSTLTRSIFRTSPPRVPGRGRGPIQSPSDRGSDYAAGSDNRGGDRLDRYRPRMEMGAAVFCCVDSITARAAIWRSVGPQCQFWADGRMLSEVIRVWPWPETLAAITTRQRSSPKPKPLPGRCTAHSTIYVGEHRGGFDGPPVHPLAPRSGCGP